MLKKYQRGDQGIFSAPAKGRLKRTSGLDAAVLILGRAKDP